MGYVLRDGKRYYQDSVGNLMLDNASQEEADRREMRSAWIPKVPARPEASTSSSFLSVLGVLLLALMLLIGAFIYNRRYVSPSENAINEYMNRHSSEYTSGDIAP